MAHDELELPVFKNLDFRKAKLQSEIEALEQEIANYVATGRRTERRSESREIATKVDKTGGEHETDTQSPERNCHRVGRQ